MILSFSELHLSSYISSTQLVSVNLHPSMQVTPLIFGKQNLFHPTPYFECNHLSMRQLKLVQYVSNKALNISSW